MTSNQTKQCDLCKISTSEDKTMLCGEWMQTKNLQVHYYCLLLSTNLLQNGKDLNGILGFLVRDIRNEIKAAAKRICCYCSKTHASIFCHNCKECFHLFCGINDRCLFQFEGQFLSYCDKCVRFVLTDFEIKCINNPPSPLTRCYICADILGDYCPVRWIYGRCCGNGFAHRYCMQGYALNAGYYLRCIWCRSEKFRALVRLQGIFVPDRDASWERETGAYRDLHFSEQKCNMDVCLCPKGADYISGKWPLTKCMLCGSFSAHNPYCIKGNMKSSKLIEEFKCDVCLKTEEAINLELTLMQLDGYEENKSVADNIDGLNVSVYMVKKPPTTNQVNMPQDDNNDDVANDEDAAKNSSVITVSSSEDSNDDITNDEDAPSISKNSSFITVISNHGAGFRHGNISSDAGMSRSSSFVNMSSIESNSNCSNGDGNVPMIVINDKHATITENNADNIQNISLDNDNENISAMENSDYASISRSNSVETQCPFEDNSDNEHSDFDIYMDMEMNKENDDLKIVDLGFDEDDVISISSSSSSVVSLNMHMDFHIDPIRSDRPIEEEYYFSDDDEKNYENAENPLAENSIEAILNVWSQVKDNNDHDNDAGLTTFDIYTFTRKNGVIQCTGTATVCKKLNDHSKITSKDFIARNKNKGIFELIDNIIEDFKTKNP